MLKSSSRSGQWMPAPSPISCHLRLSRTVPFNKRGYQTSGAETERPSLRSIRSVVASTLTLSMRSCDSIAKVFMPGFQEFRFVLFHDFLDREEFIRTEAATPIEDDWINPEFGCVLVTLDMDMRWFFTVVCIEEKPIGTDTQRGWHKGTIARSERMAMSCSGFR